MSYTASTDGTTGATTLLSLAYTRDDAGGITNIDTSGSTRGYEYDPAGRLTRVTEAGNPIAEHDYDANSNRTAHRYGGSSSATYDQQDRLITYGDTTFTYTAAGELRARTLAGATTSFDYDALGNLRTAVLPGCTSIAFVIDGQNRRIGKKLTGTLVRGWLYSGQLRIAAELDATGAIISRFVTRHAPMSPAVTMTYDANGNLLTLSPPGREAHGFTYDGLDLPATMTPPGADGAVSAATYAFDADRRLRSMVEGGRTIAIDYDTKGRVSTVSDLVHQLTLGYDSVGLLASVSNSKGPSLTYTWDGFLEKGVSWTGTITGSIAWAYDNEVRVIGESVNGFSIAFGYDADSLLASAGPVTLARNVTSGYVMQVATGAATEDYTYNEYGETRDATAKHAGMPVQSLVYARDNGGRIVGITSGSSTTGYEYDDAGRLQRVTRDGATVSEYEYDANGNRLTHRWIGGSATATYDEQDRLLQYGETNHIYTPDGALQAKTLAGATTTYDYDASGNLRNVTLPGGRKIEYVIDSENRRVGKKVDGTLVQGFLYCGPFRIVAELDGANRVVSRFVYASRANAPDAMIRDGVTYRLLSDHLGSPRRVVNTTTGAIVQAIQYDEFGNVLSDTSPGFQPFGFAGGLYDAETRLVRFGARDYDSAEGRWTAKDPIGFSGGTSNLYSYAFSDPINFADPSGLLTLPFVGWVDVGESAGSYALDQWADHIVDPRTTGTDLIGSYIGGFFAALWTPCTSDSTFTTLSLAYGANSYVGRPYYQYYPANNAAHNSPYLTRGAGWRAPYRTGAEAAENLSLPPTRFSDDAGDMVAANAFHSMVSSTSALYTITYKGI